MAKSLRSKSVRKARALRRQAIYDPVEMSRLERITKASEKTMMEETSEDVQMTSVQVQEDPATSLAGPTRRRNRKVVGGFSAYGLTAKDLSFAKRPSSKRGRRRT